GNAGLRTALYYRLERAPIHASLDSPAELMLKSALDSSLARNGSSPINASLGRVLRSRRQLRRRRGLLAARAPARRGAWGRSAAVRRPPLGAGADRPGDRACARGTDGPRR